MLRRYINRIIIDYLLISYKKYKIQFVFAGLHQLGRIAIIWMERNRRNYYFYQYSRKSVRDALKQ